MKINTNALFDELEKIAVAGPNGAKPGMSFHHWATAVFKPMKTKKASPAHVVGALLPHAIGGLIGHEQGKKQKERGENYSFGMPQIAGMVLLPGGAGYQIGRSIAHSNKDIKKGKTKNAGIFKSPKADLAGLGMLGVPVAAKLMDSKASKKEKVMAGVEGAGLGTLAAHTIATMGKHGAPAPMSSMMAMHRLADSAKAAKAAKLSGPSMIQGALRSSPNNMARANALAGHTATGGLPFTPKKAIPL